MFFSEGVSLFTYCIFHVVLGGTGEEVVWVYAGRIVAFVADEHSIWDWAVVEMVAYSVCEQAFFPDDSVSVFHFGPGPVPALVWG